MNEELMWFVFESKYEYSSFHDDEKNIVRWGLQKVHLWQTGLMMTQFCYWVKESVYDALLNNSIFKIPKVNVPYGLYTSRISGFNKDDFTPIINNINIIVRGMIFNKYQNIILTPIFNMKNENYPLTIDLEFKENPMFYFLTGFNNNPKNKSIMNRIAQNTLYDRNILRIIWKLVNFSSTLYR